MALDGTGELPDIWASALAYELRNDSVVSRITSTAYTEAWASGNAMEVKIPLPDFALVPGTTANTKVAPGDATGIETVRTTADRPSWPDITGPDVGSATFKRSATLANSMLINELDATYAAWPVVETHRSRKAYEIMNQYDTQVIAHMDGVDGTATVLGSNSNYITPAGVITGQANTVRDYPHDIMRRARLAVKTNKWMEDASRGIGAPFALMSPEIFNVLLDDLERLNYNWDAVQAQVLQNNSVLAGAGWEGRLYGIDIYTSLNMPTVNDPAGGGNANNHKVFVGTPMAVAANVRPIATQFISPEQNQLTDQIGWVLRQAVDYGVATVYSGGIIEYQIRAGSTG